MSTLPPAPPTAAQAALAIATDVQNLSDDTTRLLSMYGADAIRPASRKSCVTCRRFGLIAACLVGAALVVLGMMYLDANYTHRVFASSDPASDTTTEATLIALASPEFAKRVAASILQTPNATSLLIPALVTGLLQTTNVSMVMGEKGEPGASVNTTDLIRVVMEMIVDLGGAGSGEAGPRGYNGTKGDKGDRGDDGLSIVGPMGPPGVNGTKGDRGDDGLSIVGPEGPPGVNGTKGEKGDRGDDGLSIVGPAGPPGANGTRGDKGDPGVDGRDGRNGTWDVYSVIVSPTIVSPTIVGNGTWTTPAFVNATTDTLVVHESLTVHGISATGSMRTDTLAVAGNAVFSSNVTMMGPLTIDAFLGDGRTLLVFPVVDENDTIVLALADQHLFHKTLVAPTFTENTTVQGSMTVTDRVRAPTIQTDTIDSLGDTLNIGFTNQTKTIMIGGDGTQIINYGLLRAYDLIVTSAFVVTAATASFTGAVSMTGDSLVVTSCASFSGGITTSSILAPTGVLNVTGHATISGACTAASVTSIGNMTAGGSLFVGGNVSISGPLVAPSAVITGNMRIGTLEVGGETILRAVRTSSLDTSGPVSLAANVSVGGVLLANGAQIGGTTRIDTLAVTQRTTLEGPLSVVGIVHIASNTTVAGTLQADQLDAASALVRGPLQAIDMTAVSLAVTTTSVLTGPVTTGALVADSVSTTGPLTASDGGSWTGAPVIPQMRGDGTAFFSLPTLATNDTYVMCLATQTLLNKTLTAPSLTDPIITGIVRGSSTILTPTVVSPTITTPNVTAGTFDSPQINHILTARNLVLTTVAGPSGVSAPSMGVGSNDMSGTISFTINSGPKSTTSCVAIATVTFAVRYPYAPHVLLQPDSISTVTQYANAAKAAWVQSTTDDFIICAGTTQFSNGVYRLMYVVIG